MKKMMFVLLLTAGVLFTGCGTQFYCKRCPVETQTVTHTRDTIYKEVETVIIRRDSVIEIHIPGDSLEVLARIRCDSLYRAQMEPVTVSTGTMTATVKITDGQLSVIVDSYERKLEVLVTWYETHIKTLEKQITERDTEVTKLRQEIEEKERWFQRLYRKVFWGGLLLIAGAVIWGTRRLWMRVFLPLKI